MDSVFLLQEDIDSEINIVGVYRTEQEAKIAAGYYSYNCQLPATLNGSGL